MSARFLPLLLPCTLATIAVWEWRHRLQSRSNKGKGAAAAWAWYRPWPRCSPGSRSPPLPLPLPRPVSHHPPDPSASLLLLPSRKRPLLFKLILSKTGPCVLCCSSCPALPPPSLAAFYPFIPPAPQKAVVIFLQTHGSHTRTHKHTNTQPPACHAFLLYPLSSPLLSSPGVFAVALAAPAPGRCGRSQSKGKPQTHGEKRYGSWCRGPHSGCCLQVSRIRSISLPACSQAKKMFFF